MHALDNSPTEFQSHSTSIVDNGTRTGPLLMPRASRYQCQFQQSNAKTRAFLGCACQCPSRNHRYPLRKSNGRLGKGSQTTQLRVRVASKHAPLETRGELLCVVESLQVLFQDVKAYYGLGPQVDILLFVIAVLLCMLL